MKRLVLVITTLLFTVCLGLTCFAGTHQRVYDFARLLSESDKEKVESEIKELEDHIGMDFIVLTTGNKEGKTLAEYADDFYDYQDILDKRGDGLVMLVDMEDRTVYLSTTGHAIEYYTDDRIYSMTDGDDTLYQYLAEGDYKRAIERCIYRVSDYYDQGIEANQHTVIAKEAGARKRSLNIFEIIISLGVPAVVAFIYINGIKKQYAMQNEKNQSRNYRLAYRAVSSFAFAKATDELITHNITRTPIIIHNDNNHGSSGTSTIHMGGSGTFHGGGGGGRHF